MRAARGGDGDVEVGFEVGKQAGDGRVEGECLAVFVADGGGVGGGRSGGGDGFEGRGDVGVDPEGPEGVVEVEDDEGGEREGVG